MTGSAALWLKAACGPGLFPHHVSAQHLHEHDILLGHNLPMQLLVPEATDEPVEEHFTIVLELATKC